MKLTKRQAILLLLLLKSGMPTTGRDLLKEYNALVAHVFSGLTPAGLYLTMRTLSEAKLVDAVDTVDVVGTVRTFSLSLFGRQFLDRRRLTAEPPAS